MTHFFPAVLLYALVFGTFISPKSVVNSLPIDDLLNIEDGTMLKSTLANVNGKSARQFDFGSLWANLNSLSKLGTGILNPNRGSVNNANAGNGSGNGVQATTPRLQGRPGLGFIPDISKGVDTILEGVVSGNLEKVLEGSFVFAPTGVQLVAGNVLDRVFSSTSSPSPATSHITPVPGKNASVIQIPTTGSPLENKYPTAISKIEAQILLQQEIVKQQQQLQHLLQLQQQQMAQEFPKHENAQEMAKHEIVQDMVKHEIAQQIPKRNQDQAPQSAASTENYTTKQ